MEPKLTLELVPGPQWKINLRSELPPKDWDKLRKAVYMAANHQCELCGGKGRKHPVECHEQWHYDDKYHRQTLMGLIALCPACHEVKHFGMAETLGHGARARKHLAKVNGWTPEQVETYLQQAFNTWSERSRHAWVIDLTWLGRALA